MAAGVIAQHAIGKPDFQRRYLLRLQEAAGCGQIEAWQPAMLEENLRRSAEAGR